MTSKTADDIRREFLEYFAERGHRQVPSAPVFPQDDPTLLFTNAGMNQFKDVFLGTGERAYRRAVDTQKCIRVSGKHNDLEEVGVDTYHHTFFEMLGNWSFGDYFKEEAITWAWELLTEVWGLPKERLWVTVFGGDEADGLAADEQAERFWREKTDVDPSHVLRFDRTDNFWEMGDTGPCGPCSEIHIDRGGPGTDPADGADPALGVNAGNERFIELWNLVFIEFNRLDDRSLQKLPAQHVDTGMGFERIASVLQGKSSNYDTDVFTPIFRSLEEITGHTYGKSESVDVAFRVIADHVRAVSSAFADGALPSNVGRGYVLRRLIRRASRYGRQDLGVEEAFLYRVVPTVARGFAGIFPEISERLEHVQVQVRAEEEAFGKTLGRGLARFEQLARRVTQGAQDAGRHVIPGDEAYELYATYGFPQDLVELMARERELDVDMEGWDRARAAHQEASRSEGRFEGLFSANELAEMEERFKDLQAELPDLGWESGTRSTYHEEGRSGYEVETRSVHLSTGGTDKTGCRLVLAASPFYPESGGQVGDKGRIEFLDTEGRDLWMEVTDTRKYGNLVVHLGTWHGDEVPQQSHRVLAQVDKRHRADVRRNHTATHLLHGALREILGNHVTQQGSHVGPDRLRFDLSHPEAIGAEELDRIEERVNRAVYANDPVQTTVEDLEQAKARGVTALFGEKYDERVRVVDVGGWSTELCGGTHVGHAGDIGPFVILSEGAIQAGVRRVEAVTGAAAVRHIQEQKNLMRSVARALKSSPEEVPARVAELQRKVKQARKAAAESSKADVDQAFERVRTELRELDGVLVASVPLDLPGAALRELASRVKSLGADLAVLLLGREGERAPWIALCQGAARDQGLDARRVPEFLRPHLGGGGGGKPELTQGQGQRSAGRDAVHTLLAEDARSAFRDL